MNLPIEIICEEIGKRLDFESLMNLMRTNKEIFDYLHDEHNILEKAYDRHRKELINDINKQMDNMADKIANYSDSIIKLIREARLFNFSEKDLWSYVDDFRDSGLLVKNYIKDMFRLCEHELETFSREKFLSESLFKNTQTTKESKNLIMCGFKTKIYRILRGEDFCRLLKKDVEADNKTQNNIMTQIIAQNYM